MLDFDDDVKRCSVVDVENATLPKEHASDVCFLRKHCRCSRTNTVRCAPRLLVASHFLGPESRAF